MTRSGRTRRTSEITALELADAFANEDGAATPETVAMTRGAVLLAAEYLAEVAGPLRWEAFEARGFFEQIEFMKPRQQEGVALVLMGFYGWLAFSGRIDPGVAAGILESLRDRFPASSALAGLFSTAEPLLLEAMAEAN